jgi:hypothetical protein
MLAVLLFGRQAVAVPLNSADVDELYGSAKIVRRSPEALAGPVDHRAVDAADVDELYGSAKIVRRSPEALAGFILCTSAI